MTFDCPLCGCEDHHAPGCVAGALEAFTHEEYRTHTRALLLVTLLTHGQPTTVEELARSMNMAFYDVADAGCALMAEGLAYPWQSNLAPTLALTTAPHVQQECDRAADLLGLVLTDPRRPLSPLLGRPA